MRTVQLILPCTSDQSPSPQRRQPRLVSILYRVSFHQPRSSATGKVITPVPEATAKDVDIAVEVAQKAFDTVWGLNAPAARRSVLLGKLASLMEAHADELAALEALDNGELPA